MKTYINGLSNISPQNTFGDEEGLWANVEYHQGNLLNCRHPEYKNYFKPLQLRRMSKIIKMGLTTAMDCLNKSNVQDPGAIVVGTGLGCMADTEKFLHLVLDRNEQMLNPSPFIFSTHNTIAAQIAITLKCHSYNATYSNNGFSFENALHDGMMLLDEGAVNNVLVGGVDECTEEIFAIRSKTGVYKNKPVKDGLLYEDTSRGTIAGEGSAFFMLDRKASPTTYAVLNDLSMLYDPDQPETVSVALSDFLTKNGLRKDDLDLVIVGNNGDPAGDLYYKQLQVGLLKNINSLRYKHLCGEYYTSGAFALWLASMIIKKNAVPPAIEKENQYRGPFRKVLIYNHYGSKYHAFYLLTDV